MVVVVVVVFVVNENSRGRDKAEIQNLLYLFIYYATWHVTNARVNFGERVLYPNHPSLALDLLLYLPKIRRLSPPHNFSERNVNIYRAEATLTSESDFEEFQNRPQPDRPGLLAVIS